MIALTAIMVNGVEGTVSMLSTGEGVVGEGVEGAGVAIAGIVGSILSCAATNDGATGIGTDDLVGLVVGTASVGESVGE
jgi:hypothetical protein